MPAPYKNKFEQIRIELRLTNRDFAAKIGIQESAYSKLKKDELPIGDVTKNKIADSFPEYNIDWLLYGIGDRYKTTSSCTDKKIRDNISVFYEENERLSVIHKPIPYYDIEVSAGDINFFQDIQGSPSFMLDIPIFNDCELALTVYGDSMYPKIKNGDIILLKKLNDKSIISFGEIHLVITLEQRMLKYVRKHSEKHLLRLVSENNEYDDIEIERDKVLHLFLYKGKIEKSQI